MKLIEDEAEIESDDDEQHDDEDEFDDIVSSETVGPLTQNFIKQTSTFSSDEENLSPNKMQEIYAKSLRTPTSPNEISQDYVGDKQTNGKTIGKRVLSFDDEISSESEIGTQTQNFIVYDTPVENKRKKKKLQDSPEM